MRVMAVLLVTTLVETMLPVIEQSFKELFLSRVLFVLAVVVDSGIQLGNRFILCRIITDRISESGFIGDHVG